jgi:hypothetical protein
VLSETEGFIGQSWTVQCEIIHQMMLRAQPTYEDIPQHHDPEDLPEPPFDFFGLGQPVNQAPIHDAPE